MINSQVKVIEKGRYTRKLPKNFIDIKQFLKVERNSKRSILLRLENNLDCVVNELKIKITEYDKHGKIIGKSVRSFCNLKIIPNKLYSLDEGISIKNECEDFEIQIIKARSGNYEYILNGEDVLVYYAMPNLELSALSGPACKPKIRKTHKYNVSKIMVASVLSLLFIMLGAYLVIYSNYTKDVYGTSIWLVIAKDVWNAVKNFTVSTAIIIKEATVFFFTQIMPEVLRVSWQGIVWFITEGVPIAFDATIEGLGWFFKVGIPTAFRETWQFLKYIVSEIGLFFKSLK